jgi:hypothetical protein
MKMAKASEADLNMAMELVGALDVLGQRWCPAMPESIENLKDEDEREIFDRDDDAQCGRALRYLLDRADRASLARVVWGMVVVCDPRNEVIDPEADTLEVHPKFKRLAAELRARKDAAYLERNQVVAALSKMFRSGKKRTAIEGWSEDWHGCVYIDLPTGQASWHYHDSQAYLFDHLPEYQGEWDGHSTEEKYARIAALPTIAQWDDDSRGFMLAPCSWYENDGTTMDDAIDTASTQQAQKGGE